MKYFQKFARKLIAFVLTLAISIPLFTVGVLAESDITNHWAGNTIKEWLEKGIASGYGDGTFKPENSITRAEFMNLVNNALGYTKESMIQFKDVTEGKWYYNVIQKAVAAGYIAGYVDGTMKPNSPITRQEVAVIICKIKNAEQSPDSSKHLTDENKIETWSKGYIGAVVRDGYMGGYTDGSFKATAQIKRGEAITVLNNVISTVTYNKPGTYGPATGTEIIKTNVIVKADGVILQNIHIKGNLTIAEEVGKGNVTLNNVTVDGETFIRGGGKDSIHINGGQYHKITVQKTSSGQVRIVAIDVKGTEVIISEQAAGETIILEGKFDSVKVDADNVEIKTQGNTQISEMKVGKEAQGCKINLEAGTKVTKLILEVTTDVKGNGTITEAIVSEGVKPPSITPTITTSAGGGSSQPLTQVISGTLTVSAGVPDLTAATIQLKKANVNVGAPIHPAANGTYNFAGISAGTGYTITANLNGYYEFSTALFDVVNGTNISGKNLEIARKEPIITTQTSTTVTKGTDGVSIAIDLTSGKDYPAQVLNLGHTFADNATVTNLNNWTVNTGTTGLTFSSITKNSDTQVTLNFTGLTTNARAFTVQAEAAAISGNYSFDSNVLAFSVVQDDLITDSTGGMQIYYAKNTDVQDMRAVVVMVHGLAEHLGRYNESAEALNAAGYGVYRLDNKGHGKTGVANGDQGYVEDFSEYYEDIDLVVDIAKAENPGKPVYMLGHSMGGLLTAMYGVTYTSKLDGQIISGGATGPYYLSFGLDDAAFYTAVGGANSLVPNSLTSTVCRYPAIQSYYYVDPLRLTSYTRKLQWETFGAGSKYLEDQITAGNYTYPVFIIHGGDDRIVSKAFSESLNNNIDSVDKTLTIYPGLYHESLNERNEKVVVTEDIINWLDARVQ